MVLGMRLKMYKMRGRTLANGKNDFIDLQLEFEGKRAFVICDTVTLGKYLLKARLEIDPKRLKKVRNRGCDFLYRGELLLPRPQDN